MPDDPTPDPDPKPDPTPNPTPDPPPDPKPDPDEPFDKDRALETIRKQREAEAAAVKRAKELEAKIKEYEDRDKTESQRAAEARETAVKEAAEAKAEALRLRVAMKHGLSEEDLDLLGTGDEEQIEKRAKRLADLAGGQGDGGQERRRPRETLRPGGAPSAEPEENDPRKLAAEVSRSW